jgi:hypothetical protein
MAVEVSTVAELEFERRFTRQYVYGRKLLPPDHYRSSIARERE